MKKLTKTAVYIHFYLVFSIQFLMAQEPIAPINTKTLTIHGHSRNDDYYWMNERDSKPVLDHLSKENTYVQAYFQKLKPLQEKLLTEFESRIDPNEASAPFILNGVTYQVRNEEGKDYVKIYKLSGKSEALFLDQNERAKGKSFYELADWANSPDNNLLALGEDLLGRRKYQITFRKNKDGKFLKDKITDTDGSIVWANDNKTIFYIKKDPQTLREYQVYSHVLGTDVKKDRLVYQEDDEKFSVHISKSTSDRYIFIHCTSSTTSELRMIDGNEPSGDALVFWKRQKGHIYDVEHHDNGFYILSNMDAKNGKILFCKALTKDEAVTEFVSHSADRL
ncbi:MAG: hypothetical protein RIT43_2430, partial [Bacteroidota bacterium]